MNHNNLIFIGVIFSVFCFTAYGFPPKYAFLVLNVVKEPETVRLNFNNEPYYHDPLQLAGIEKFKRVEWHPEKSLEGAADKQKLFNSRVRKLRTKAKSGRLSNSEKKLISELDKIDADPTIFDSPILGGFCRILVSSSFSRRGKIISLYRQVGKRSRALFDFGSKEIIGFLNGPFETKSGDIEFYMDSNKSTCLKLSKSVLKEP